MAKIEVKSVQKGVPSVWVEVEGVTDAQFGAIRAEVAKRLKSENQVSTAVSKSFQFAVSTCPTANPSDLWHHLIYRQLLELGYSDQQWKRISGFALERALVDIYAPYLAPYGLRMRIVDKVEATAILKKIGLDVRAVKIDLFLEGRLKDEWGVFGAAHAKSSIAERIQDDVPASVALMTKGLASILLTMDMKSYPPPHGGGINYGELGGRSFDVDKERMKRDYVEKNGQFDALFSFNLRTPPSPEKTASGRRIWTLPLSGVQPDSMVQFLRNRWEEASKKLVKA